MMVHKITPSVDYNQWLERLNTELNETTYWAFESEKAIIKLWGLV